ncbi:MAG: FAD-dependent oxidoreductase [Nocardioides sp.]|nr:FAD-dependent oxidoreductase [Nocardioides sp.]
MGTRRDVVIVGGGFYGLRIALHLREHLGMKSLLVLEKEPEAMNRASYANQARLHNGYHYPRSILTAYRSRVNLPRFVSEFGDAVIETFEHYYAVASRLSKTNAHQFELFCSRIGATYEPADPLIMRWFNPNMIESAYRVHEPVFDARILREMLLERIALAGGIELLTDDEVSKVEKSGSAIDVYSTSGKYAAGSVINATYSRLNGLHRRSGLPIVPLQHELTEMALVKLDPPFAEAALTVMDGPFFSIMPFPSRGLHTLSHVRYTPYHRWVESDVEGAVDDSHDLLRNLPTSTRFPAMYADVLRYVPALAGMQRRESIWEVKTVLTKSDKDDGRPILFRPHHGLKNFTTIMGGKIDNIYDVLEELNLLYG